MCFVHAVACSNYKKTHIKMIGVQFHEKSGLEKKLWFPENSEFFEIHEFRQNTPKLVTSRLKFPGICVTPRPKNARIYGFPWILEHPFRIFPGNFHDIPKISNFPEFQKTPKFRGKGGLDKKGPKFSIFSVFFTKFCGAYQVYIAS